MNPQLNSDLPVAFLSSYSEVVEARERPEADRPVLVLTIDFLFWFIVIVAVYFCIERRVKG